MLYTQCDNPAYNRLRATVITGRTAIYLYDDKSSGLAAKKTTTSVQSHEVAHQWFVRCGPCPLPTPCQPPLLILNSTCYQGNVVTMEWWDKSALFAE